MTNGDDSVDYIPDDRTEFGETIFGASGLTKREYFAATAMQGFLANAFFSEAEMGGNKLIPAAVGAADLLIKELNK